MECLRFLGTSAPKTIHSNLLLDVVCIVSSGTLYCRSVITDRHDYSY